MTFKEYLNGLLPSNSEDDKYYIHNYKDFVLRDNATLYADITKNVKKLVVNAVTASANSISPNISFVLHGVNFDAGFGYGVALNLMECILEKDSNMYYCDALGDFYKIGSNGVAKNGMIYTTSKPENIINLPSTATNGVTAWLTDGTIVRGFNTNGNLILVTNYYGKYFKITYNSQNQVCEVTEWFAQNNAKFSFNYDNSTLKSIDAVDSDGNVKTTKFYYVNGSLTTISYPEGIMLNFSYLANYLNLITATDGHMYKITPLACGYELSLHSNITSIPNGIANSNLLPYASWRIIVESGIVTITDVNGDKRYFKYRNDNFIHTELTEKGGIITDACYKTMSKRPVGGFQIYTSYPLPSCLNKDGYDDFRFYGGGGSIELLYNKSYQLESEEYKCGRHPDCDMDEEKLSYKKLYTYNDNNKVRRLQTHFLIFGDVTYKLCIQITDFEYNAQGKVSKKTEYVEEEVSNNGKTVEEYEYDNYGNVKMLTSYNTKEPNKKFITETGYDKYGRQISVKPDVKVNAASTCFYGKTLNPAKATMQNGTEINYSYDAAGRMTGLSATCLSGSQVNGKGYTKDEITSLTGGNNKINFAYDSKRRVKQVDLDGTVYETFTYSESNDSDTVTITNAKSEQFICEKLKDHSKVTLKYNTSSVATPSVLYTAELQANGDINKETDGVTGEINEYAYNSLLQPVTYTRKKYGTVTYLETYGYDDIDRFENVNMSGEVNAKYIYKLRNDIKGQWQEEISEIDYTQNGNTVKTVICKDMYDRYAGKTVKYNGTEKATETLTYKDTSTRLTQLPDKITYNNGDSVQYIYDDSGNILSVNYGDITYTYTYDEFNRLTGENGTAYSYDVKGNMLSAGGVSYSYSGGKLVGVGDKTITYDSVGNPVNYLGNTMFWTKGKQLISYKNNTFAYNGKGLRRSKNSITFTYDSKDRLIKQSNGLTFFYDHTGVAGFIYNNSTYFYRKDIQGNIIAILDSNGSVVVQYRYNAWGEHKIVNANGTTVTSGVGVLNPFRYRGYYYDTETGFYYLQSRYYDPAISRFINMDSVDYADPTQINGLNLYAYCNNNPVMNIDPTGHSVLGFLIGMAIGLLVSIIVSEISGQHAAAGVGLTAGGLQTSLTGISLFSYGPVGWILGTISIVLGIGSMIFGSAELQQGTTGSNWIKDAGLSDGWYNGLMWTTATLSTVASIAGSAYMCSSTGSMAHEIQANAKYWDKGTFSTKYGSLKYHYGKHGQGLSPTAYTQYALDFSNFNSSSFTYTFNYKYGNASWYFSNMFGVGGYFTSKGKIITFWF